MKNDEKMMLFDKIKLFLTFLNFLLDKFLIYDIMYDTKGGLQDVEQKIF